MQLFHRYAAQGTFLLVAAFAVLATFFAGLTNDTDLLLHVAAHAVYDGGLYQHWISVNSPIIFAVYTLPVLCSIGLKLPAVLFLHGMTVAICGFDLLLLRHLLRDLPAQQRKLWLAAAAVTLLVVPWGFQVFGDREHYLFIFALPWALTMLLGLEPAVPTAAMAALGLCIKPYNLLLLPVMALFAGPRPWPLKRRLFSASVITILCLFLTYLATVALFFPDYFRVLHIALVAYSSVTYSAGTRRLEAAMAFAGFVILIAGLEPPARRIPFLAFAATLCVIYSLNAGWKYTQYLIAAPLMLLCPALWLSDAPTLNFVRKSLAVLICGFLLALSTYDFRRDIVYTARTGSAFAHAHLPPSLRDRLRAEGGQRFMLFSTNLWSSNVADLRGPHHSLFPYDDSPWPLSWLKYKPHDPRHDEIWQDALLRPLLATLGTNPPPVLIVDESPAQFVDVFALFTKDESAQKILSGYERRLTIDECAGSTDHLECRFSVWHRKPGIADPH